MLYLDCAHENIHENKAYNPQKLHFFVVTNPNRIPNSWKIHFLKIAGITHFTHSQNGDVHGEQ